MAAIKEKSRAFTLVELLVVISIIALLLATLMPALQKAREKAKEIVDLSNSKNQGVTFQTYASDASGKYPLHSNMWPNVLRDWNYPGSGQPVSRRPDIYTTDLITDLKNYVGNPKVLYCPFQEPAQGGKGPDRAQYPTNHPPMAGWNGGPKGDIVFRYTDYELWFNYRTVSSLFPSKSSDEDITYLNNNKAVRTTSDASSRRAIVSEGTCVNADNSGGKLLTWKFTKGALYPPQSTAHPFSVGGSNVLYGDFHAEKRKWTDIKAQILVYAKDPSTGAGPLVAFYW